jgi:hypothetical protein
MTKSSSLIVLIELIVRPLSGLFFHTVVNSFICYFVNLFWGVLN